MIRLEAQVVGLPPRQGRGLGNGGHARRVGGSGTLTGDRPMGSGETGCDRFAKVRYTWAEQGIRRGGNRRERKERRTETHAQKGDRAKAVRAVNGEVEGPGRAIWPAGGSGQKKPISVRFFGSGKKKKKGPPP